MEPSTTDGGEEEDVKTELQHESFPDRQYAECDRELSLYNL